jgi:hypothetical protein
VQKNDTLIGDLGLAWKLIGSTLGLALLLVGVPISEVARVACVILIQSTVGIIIWNFLIPPRNTDAVFRIGSGIFFGIAISTIFQQIFIGSIFSSSGWLFTIPVASAAFFAQRPDSGESPEHDQVIPKNPVLVFLFCTLFGLLDQWWWLLPIGIITAVFIYRSVSTKLLTLALFLMPFAIWLSISLRQKNSLWWIISNDTPFLESTSFSINKWGPRTNISSAGGELSYHWFSLAWSGMISSVSNADSWTVLTYCLPVVSILVTGLLIYSVVFHLTDSKALSLVSVLSVLSIRDVVSTTSPSQVFSFMPLLVICGLALRKLAFTYRYLAVLFLLIFSLWGSKVSAAAVIVSGLVISTLLDKQMKFIKRLYLISGVGLMTALAYFYFYAQSRSYNQLSLGLSNAGGRLVLGREVGGGRFHIVIELATLLIYLFPLLAGIILFFLHRDKAGSDLRLLVILVLSGVILITIVDGGGTESYFLFATYPFAIMLTFILIFRCLKGTPKQKRYVLIFFSLGLSGGFLRRVLSFWISDNTIPSLINHLAPYLLMYFVFSIISLAVLVRYQSRGVSVLLAVTLFCLLLISSVLGDQAHRRYSFAKSAITLNRSPESEFFEFNFFAGSPNRVAALEWLRANSPEESLVGINRFCLSQGFCGPKKYFLASAISHRKMFIEGYHYSVGIYPEPQWAQERLDVSERFGEKATKMDYEFLKSEGVSYFIVDLEYVWSYETQNWETPESAQMKSWEPYATTVFKNEEMAILKLN